MRDVRQAHHLARRNEGSVAANAFRAALAQLAPCATGSGSYTVPFTFSDGADSATIDANGQWSISILQGAVVDIWISLTNGKDLSASHRLIPNTDTANYEDLEYQS